MAFRAWERTDFALPPSQMLPVPEVKFISLDFKQTVGALIGTLMTIYGRMRATVPLQRSLLKQKG